MFGKNRQRFIQIFAGLGILVIVSMIAMFFAPLFV